MSLDFLIQPPAPAPTQAPAEAVADADSVTAAVPNWNERPNAEKAALMDSFLERSRAALIIKTSVPSKLKSDAPQLAGHVIADISNDLRKLSKFELLLLETK